MSRVIDNLTVACDELAGKRVGLVGNQTSVLQGMTHLVDALVRADSVNLVALFAPEHGFYGEMDAQISSGTDARTGLPIHSLYGRSRRPSCEMLGDVDVLLFSLQDVGVRFYTYISTMYHCMEAVVHSGVGFFVVDRPNPITGTRLEGNVSERTFSSFVAVRPLPIRHGMTIGELAMMFKTVDEMSVDLTVVKIDTWERRQWFDETEVP